MTPEETAALAAHNERVRALAGKMPVKALASAICAIGYRADKATGITAGYSVATMARLSRGKPWAISVRTLKRAIPVLTAAEVIAVRQARDDTGRVKPNVYALSYSYTDAERVSEAWATANNERRKERLSPSVCRVCLGLHDPGHGGKGAEAWGCGDCQYHLRHMRKRR
jgi:hypothetical protein